MAIRIIHILLGGVFVLFFYLGLKTPLYADDYGFARIPFSDAFTHAVNFYFTWGGRVLGNFWPAFMNSLPACVSAAIFSFCICLLFIAIHLLTYGTGWKKNLALDQTMLPVAVFYLFLPDVWEVVLWRTGTYYLMAALFSCLFLIPYRFLLDGKNLFPRQSFAWLFIIFAVSVPFWVEVVIAPILFLGAILLLILVARKQIGFWPTAAYVAFLAGSVMTLAAPGNFVRAEANQAFIGAVFIRTVAALAFKYAITVFFPSVLFVLFALASRRRDMPPASRGIWKTGACLFFASIASSAILLGAGGISYRALSFSFILVLLAMNMAYGKARRLVPLLKGIPLVLLGVAFFWGTLTCIDFTSLKEAALHRDLELAASASAGEKIVFLKEYPRIRQSNFTFIDSLRGNPRAEWGAPVASMHGLEHAYLLMDSEPETLDSQATQKWQGALQIAPSLALCSLFVTERGTDTVLTAVFSGDVDHIKELVFLSVSEDSPARAKLAQLLLPAVSAPEVVSSLPQRFLGELLDRTMVLPAPNTFRTLEGTAMYYTKLHPLAGRRGGLEVSINIKTEHGTVMARVPLPKRPES